jgi:serine/threonine protein kinase
MQHRVSLERRDTGHVVVKTAVDSEGAARLRIEHKTLVRLDHPGVVTEVCWRDDAEGCALETEFVESARSAGDLGVGLDLRAALGLAVSLTSVLRDLHEGGVSHGNLTADHVLVEPSGGVVLCSLGSSQPITPEAMSADLGATGDVLLGLWTRLAEPMDRHEVRVKSRWHHLIARAKTGEVTAGDLAVGTVEIFGLLRRVPVSAQADWADWPLPNVGALSIGPPLLRTRREIPKLDGTRTWHNRVETPPEPEQPRSRALLALALVVACASASWIGTRLIVDLPLSPFPSMEIAR